MEETSDNELLLTRQSTQAHALIVTEHTPCAEIEEFLHRTVGGEVKVKQVWWETAYGQALYFRIHLFGRLEPVVVGPGEILVVDNGRITIHDDDSLDKGYICEAAISSSDDERNA